MNDISHKQAIQLIHRRADGLLTESQRLSLEEHLHSCDACRAYAVELDGLSAHLQNEFHRRWDDEFGPSQNVFKQVTAKARRIPVTNRISVGAKLLTGAMALIILGVAINFVVSRLQSTSPIANATETMDTTSLAQNRLLAFASDQNGNSDIYTVHADGSGLVNITNHPAFERNPFWSPDGKRIAFEREQDGFTQIYLMDGDGANVVQLTNDQADHFLPMNIDGRSNPWSPDGSKLLYLQQEPRADLATLYSTDIDGGNVVMLASGNIQYNNLSWSPDGKHVGYVLNESPTPDTTFVPGIYVIESSGNSAVAVSKLVPQGESVANWSYYWSPAGNSMIFMAHRHIDEGQDQWVVYEASLINVQLVERATSSGYMEDWWQGTSFIRDLDGQSLRWLRADGTFNVLKPAEICPSSADSSNGFLAHRSPNGSQIVNVVCPNNQMLFYYVNSDATIIKPLLDFSIPAFAMDNSVANMAWSSDDRFVAISLISPKKSTLYILNVKDNSKSEEIIRSEGDFYAIPSWQPIVDENIAEEIPTPQPPSISSSQRLIAFTSIQNGNADIYTMHADGSGLRNITSHSAYDGNPFWSPDGKRIAFERDQEGFTQIFLMDADGANVTQLTNDEADHFLPMNIDGISNPWSPDGNKLLFVQWEPGAEMSTLYSIDIHGENKVRFASGNISSNGLSWSPNGKYIGYVLNTSDTTFVPDIYVADSTGSNIITVSELVPEIESLRNQYYWSQGGNSLLFTARRHMNQSIAYEASLMDGQLIERATSSGFMEDWWEGTSFIRGPGPLTLTWLRADGTSNILKPREICQSTEDTPHAFIAKRSSNGNQIVNVICPNEEMRFYYVNSDATIIKPLLDSPISSFAVDNSRTNMTWSPDDRFIAISLVSPKKSSLYILNVKDNSKSEEIVLSDDDFYTVPSWQPVPSQEIVEEQPTLAPEPTQAVEPERSLPIGTGVRNGEWIAFTGSMVPDSTDPTALTDNRNVYLIHPDGSGLVNLTNSPDAYFWPAWSPNGENLLFLRSTGTIDILRKTESNGFEVLVSTGMKYEYEVSAGISPDAPFAYWWSPNSDQIAYIDNRSGNSDIYTIYADGRSDTQPKQLTNDPGQEIDFAWSPDGSQIAYQKTDGEQLSIMVMNADGSKQHEVARGMGRVHLRWSMDGTSLYANSVYLGPTESQKSHLDCEECVPEPAVYQIDLDGPSVRQIYYEEDGSFGWVLYDTPQNGLYFMRLLPDPPSLGIWGTWRHWDGNAVREIGEMDPQQTCKTTTGNILNEHISPNERFSIITNSCAGGFDLYLADREAATPEQRLTHLLRLPLNTIGQGANDAYLSLQWSPDGRRLIYDDGRGVLYLLDIERAMQDPDTGLTPFLEPIYYIGTDGLLSGSSQTITALELTWQPKP